MHLAEHIIAAHALVGDPAVGGRSGYGSPDLARSDQARPGQARPGQITRVAVDRVYVQDGNSPTIAKIFQEYNLTEVFDPDRIGVFFDHSVLPPNVGIADRLREAEAFCERFGLRMYRAGTGISHHVALEEGWFEPGSIVLGSDSHTCTGGVHQSLALGMGASDIAAAMVSGETWLRVPETVCLETVGMPARCTGAKDVMLAVLGRFGLEPFLYRSVEWTGPWLEQIDEDQAVTIADMAVEMGAKCAFLPPGPGRRNGMRALKAEDGGYAEHLRIDISGLPPFIARPHAPSNTVPIDDCHGLSINHVYVGSCANSRLEDLRQVADVLCEQSVHPTVTLVVTPGSKQVYLDSMRLGYVETIVKAGGLVTPPGCGSCLGTQGPIPASGDRVLSTMNRNFRGRMGNRDAEIYLASPLVAAHTAVRGEIPKAEVLV